MKKLFLLLITLILLTTSLNAQFPPCAPTVGFYTFKEDKINDFPTYNTGMPIEVLIAYIAIDSLAYHGYPYNIQEFLNRQAFNDTLRTIMKYYYWAVDFDPIAFANSAFYKKDSTMMNTLSNLAGYVDNAVKKISPNSILDYALCRTHLIAHIMIEDTITYTDTTISGVGRYIVNVTSEIIDTIKGKTVPPCSFDNPPSKIKNKDGLLASNPALPGTCLKFSYCPDWQRTINQYYGTKKRLVDSAGNPWIKKGQEYIVFLNYLNLCDNSSYNYLNTRPIAPYSATFLMFPISNGIVYDPSNDFGFGTGLTVEQFKTALRNRINYIKYYSGN